MRRLEPMAPMLVLFLALLLRIVYVHQLRASPLFDTLIMDELYHDRWAKALASGNWIGDEVFFRAPLYPYFLGVLYRVFGQNYLLVRLIQGFMGSASCMLIYLLARRTFNFAVAFGSGIAAAFYPMLIYYDGELLITGLIVFLDLLLIVSLLKAEETGTAATFLLSGFLLGLSAIARPNILLFLPPVVLWILLAGFPKHKVHRRILFSVSVLAACCAAIAPVTVRNYIVGKDFVPISSQAGINFYIGNNPHSDGVTAVAPGMRGTWRGGYEDAIRMANRAEGRTLKPSEVSDYWMRRGIDFMRRSPSAYSRLLAKKAWLFFRGQELSNNKDIYFFGRRTGLLRLLLFERPIYFPFGIVSALSLLGMFLSLKDWKKLFLLHSFVISYAVSVIIFFITSRYRMPVIPILLIFSGYAVWRVLAFFRKRRFRCACASLGCLAVLLLLSTSRFVGAGVTSLAQSYCALGTVYGRKGEVDEAARFYRMAIKLDSTFAACHNNLGNILARKGDLEGARDEYRKSIEVDPSFSKAYFNLANTYYAQDDFENAARYYEQAVRADSFYVGAAYSAGLAYQRLGRMEDAIEMLEHAGRLAPDNREILEKLSEVRRIQSETP